MKGLTAPPSTAKVGLRASITGEIVMDDVFVPEENAFQKSRPEGPFTCLNSALRHRLGAGWALNSAGTRLASTRWTANGSAAPSPPNQLIQKKLADMQTEIASACRACLQFAAKDAGRQRGSSPPSSKRNSCGKAL